VSCIPVAIVGLLLKDFVEDLFGGNLTVVGCSLIVTALLLAFAYFFRTRPLSLHRDYKPREISWLDAIVIGCAQAVAVLPGLSRSGTTIATGILLGDNREKVAQFSFFMVIIPILGEALLDIKKMFGAEAVATETSMSTLSILIGFIAAFVVGCIACKWMIELVKRGKLIWFAVYCLVVGIVCLIW
jgi:undecaprenyl-diphosphatase